MLISELPTEKSLVVSFWIFFQISWQPRRIRKNRNHERFCWCRSIYLWITSSSPVNKSHFWGTMTVKAIFVSGNFRFGRKNIISKALWIAIHLRLYGRSFQISNSCAARWRSALYKRRSEIGWLRYTKRYHGKNEGE